MERSQHIDMNEKQRKQTITLAVLGGTIIAVILLVTTIWVTGSARTGTQQAVSKVSEFYLEELAGRRAQVVSEELKNNLAYMENALTILEEPYLESQETLRSFLGKVKRLYGVDKFALVDENGIVYTEHSTTSGLSRYSFLSEKLTGPVISTLNLYGARKQVILAIPVEGISFQGTDISVCFIQLNIDEMLSSLTLQTSENETYCNLFYRNGENLTDNEFGYLKAGNNLLLALADAQMGEGYSYEQLKQDFAEGRKGQASFKYHEFQDDLCYIPVEGTNWMLTILVRDNVISNQIGSISQSMLNRSIIQIIITVISMLSVFLVFIYQSTKTSRILLEQEKADGNRIRAAYAQIEREQSAMENIHAAMGSGLWSMEFNEKAEMVSCTWTNVFRKMVGYDSEEDFPNRLESWSDLLNSEDKERILKEYWDTVKDYSGQKTYNVEYRLRTRHAGWRWFHAAGRLSRRADGSPLMFVGLFVDIDDEKKMEEQLEKQKVDLQDALAAAQHANKAKTTFLNNMSHDIRTPMNAIVGFTTLAITHLDDKEQVEEYLKKIMTSGNHLLSLINDVLDMSRIESGKMHLDEKPCRLPDILHGLRNILQADVHAKQLELYIDAVDVWDENIYCDKLRLNQILLNLLSNAVKYTGAGGTISMRITEKPGAQKGYANYEFHIKDTGIGMSEEFVAHIFEPFEREKSSTISGIQGTGLGMAITKNIVDMMNGTIAVESEQGVGTEATVCFTFRLNTGVIEPRDIPELKNCRALVVDDDFNTCDSVTYMLSQIGMRAEWTLSGREALLRTRQAVTRNDIYNVYVIDWMLPDMNGIEVTRRIRKEMGDDVPIILLTAYDWLDIEEEAKEAGITSFCSKPLFLSELRSCLHSIVNAEETEGQKSEEKSEKRYTGRILLAEDNELNQEIAVAILGNAGFTTEVAMNGKIAVEMLEKSEPGYYQLVLMDVRMPVMDGYEATKLIRSLDNAKLSSIPILAMTANAFEEDRQEALRSGMNGHLAKPIDVEALFDALDKILK